jgi:hypothetical protein
MIALQIFGLLFGALLMLDGALNWGLVATVRPASRTEIRVSETVIGALFVVLAVLLFLGVIHAGG